MKHFSLGALVGLGLLLSSCAVLDQVVNAVGNVKVEATLKNGEKVQGTLLKGSDGKSVIQVKYGSVTLTSGEIASIQETGKAEPPKPGQGRLSRWDWCLQTVASRAWASHLKQIPATVISTGSLRNLPYMSHKSGSYEFNVYGDPDRPVGLEVGVYPPSDTPAAKQACLETMLLVLTDSQDQAFLKTLKLNEGKTTRGSLVFEVTPPSAPDSCGGWWLSIYDPAVLEPQRVTEQEMPRLSLTGQSIIDAERDKKGKVSVLSWKSADLAMARPQAGMTLQTTRVYVRGLHRKGDEYVVPNAN